MLYVQFVVRSLISLVALFVITKFIGYRQISEISLFDYVNGITMGSVAAEIVFSESDTWGLLLSLVIYGITAVAISWAADKSLPLRRFMEGRPSVLYENGIFFYKNMRKSKIDLSEFLMVCREQGYFNLSEVQCAVLESNGKVSILPKAAHRPLAPSDLNLTPEHENLYANVILEGQIMFENLQAIGRDENWLRKQMHVHNIKHEKNVFLAICDGQEACYFFEKDEVTKPLDKLI